MHLLSVIDFNQLLKSIVIMLLTILLIGSLLKKLNQPYFVAYIIAGILLGPGILTVFKDAESIAVIGELGLLIQMFFIGTKMEISSLRKDIHKPVIGVAAQLVFSFLFILLLGYLQDWSWKEIILFTFIISLSSSAIILEYLEKNNEINTALGALTSGILVLQDFLLLPMLVTLNFIGKKNIAINEVIPMAVALLVIGVFLRIAFSGKSLDFQFLHRLKNDHEAQVFTGLLICFGFGLSTQALHLSAGIGALMGGVLIAKSRSMQWLEVHLNPFRVFFVSLFFLSIGLQINTRFLADNIMLICMIVAIIMLVNSAINAFVFRLLKMSWRDSVYAGALLSQVGEFSLVLCMVARSQQLVNEFWYQLTLTVVSATMLMTAIWINIIRAFIHKQNSHVRSITELLFNRKR